MIATTHMLVAAAAGSRARSIPAAAAIGVLTHLMLDAVPHRDYRRRALGGLALPADLAAGAASVAYLSRSRAPALVGALGGALPDALRVVERATGCPVTSWAHDMAHSENETSALRSTAVQGAIALAAAAVIVRGG